jgi:alpha-L-fucosidase 2
LGSFANAARQQWGSQGIWIPETSYFDGLEDLPDGVAEEMRKLYLGPKTVEGSLSRVHELCTGQERDG